MGEFATITRIRPFFIETDMRSALISKDCSLTVGAIHESPGGITRVLRVRPGKCENRPGTAGPFVNGPYRAPFDFLLR